MSDEPVRVIVQHWDLDIQPYMVHCLTAIQKYIQNVGTRHAIDILEAMLRTLSPENSYGRKKDTAARYAAGTEDVELKREFPGLIRKVDGDAVEYGEGKQDGGRWVEPSIQLSHGKLKCETFFSEMQEVAVGGIGTRNALPGPMKKKVAKAVCKVIALMIAVNKDVTNLIYPRAVIRGSPADRRNALRRTQLDQTSGQGCNYSNLVARILPNACLSLAVTVGKYIGMVQSWNLRRGEISKGLRSQGTFMQSVVGVTNFAMLFGTPDNPRFSGNWDKLNRVVTSAALIRTISPKQIPCFSVERFKLMAQRELDDALGQLQRGVFVAQKTIGITAAEHIGNIPVGNLLHLRELGVLNFSSIEIGQYVDYVHPDATADRWDRQGTLQVPNVDQVGHHCVAILRGRGRRDGGAVAGASASNIRTTTKGLDIAWELTKPVVAKTQMQSKEDTTGTGIKVDAMGNMFSYTVQRDQAQVFIKTNREKRVQLTQEEKDEIQKRRSVARKRVTRFLNKAEEPAAKKQPAGSSESPFKTYLTNLVTNTNAAQQPSTSTSKSILAPATLPAPNTFPTAANSSQAASSSFNFAAPIAEPQKKKKTMSGLDFRGLPILPSEAANRKRNKGVKEMYLLNKNRMGMASKEAWDAAVKIASTVDWVAEAAADGNETDSTVTQSDMETQQT